MEVRFLELKQESMSVVEYATKFNELARFSPHQVDTEKRKAKRFEQGLKSWIYSIVVVLRIKTFTSLLERAIIIDGWGEDLVKIKLEYEIEQEDEGIKEFNSGGFKSNKRKRIDDISREVKLKDAENNIKVCVNCRRNRQGVCLRGSYSCYRCGHSGHVASNCVISTDKGKRCFACGATSHQVKNCPIKENVERIGNKSKKSGLVIESKERQVFGKP